MNTVVKIAVQSALLSIIWVSSASAIVDPQAGNQDPSSILSSSGAKAGQVLNLNGGVAIIRGETNSAVERYLARRQIVSANNVDYVIDLSTPIR